MNVKSLYSLVYQILFELLVVHFPIWLVICVNISDIVFGLVKVVHISFMFKRKYVQHI